MVSLPCSDLRVLDLSSGPAALAAMVLADFGADVIRVEPPNRRPLDAVPAYRQWNRGKRIHVTDLRSDAGRSELDDLTAQCDVVIENLRDGAAVSLGVDWERLSAQNPGLVLLSISGFGSQGPLATTKGYEGVVAARTGQFVIQNGYRADGPIYDAVPKGVFGAAMLGLTGVLVALEHRSVTGAGTHVETSLLQSNFVYSYNGIRHADPAVTRAMSLAQGRDPLNDSPGYRIAQCADGQWIQSGSFGPGIFENLMRALGIDEYFTDPRFAAGVWSLGDTDRRALIDLIDAAYRRRTLPEWITVLDDHDAAYGRFLTTQEYMDHPQMVHNRHVIEVDDPVVGPSRQLGPLATFASFEWEWPGPPSPSANGMPPRWRSARRALPATVPGASGASALSHLRIVDLAMYAAAPGGPGLLAELGAEVIKVEPLAGDPTMRTGGELFARITRGKRRVSIDLKTPDGQALLRALVATSDVVVHNFRPGVPERLGAGYDLLRQVNPRLVYVYAAAFGSTGPDARRPAFDPVISAMAGGELLQSGEGNPPQQRQTSDHSALLGVAAAILLGVRQRDRTGEAQYVETTMLASAAYLFSDDFIDYPDKPPRPQPDRGQHGLDALYRLYRAQDGKWLFLACLRADEWKRLCHVVGRGLHDRFPDAHLNRRAEGLAECLASAFDSRPAADWERDLHAADVACAVADGTWQDFLYGEEAPVDPSMVTSCTLPDVGAVRHTGRPVTLSCAQEPIGRLEALGESTVAVLSETGLDDYEIADLVTRRVVFAAPSADS
jgi:crotonobetainyl-CoA:carnitine CoA-transferase CaiB-like acyl-CoA transferase